MPEFTVNPARIDPYKDFKFRVRSEGRYLAGVSKVSGLTRTTEVVAHRDGGSLSQLRKSPGKTTFAPLIMERGLTHDTEFETWAEQVWSVDGVRGAEVALANFRRDLTLELQNEAGQIVLAYRIFRCWVSEYTAIPELDSNSGGVAIERVVVEHEGWTRDRDVTEPTEPKR